MQIIKNNKVLSILVAGFICLLLFYVIRHIIASNTIYTESYLRDEEYIMNPKVYGVNEYSVANISNEQMAGIYLADFRNSIYEDINITYNLLNETYRNIKFGSLENFKNYLNSNNITVKVSKYYFDQDNGYDIYGVYDSNDNLIIFKTKGVMQYEVYLDDYTVEI